MPHFKSPTVLGLLFPRKLVYELNSDSLQLVLPLFRPNHQLCTRGAPHDCKHHHLSSHRHSIHTQQCLFQIDMKTHTIAKVYRGSKRAHVNFIIPEVCRQQQQCRFQALLSATYRYRPRFQGKFLHPALRAQHSQHSGLRCAQHSFWGASFLSAHRFPCISLVESTNSPPFDQSY